MIDSHIHPRDLYVRGGRDCRETLQEYKESRGFQAINLTAIPAFGRDVRVNIAAALFKARHPENYIHGGLLYPSYPVKLPMPEGMDFLTQYRELMEIGFDGIKMIETKPNCAKMIGLKVNDEIYEPLLDAIEKDGTHTIWHVADPEVNWDVTKVLPEHLARGWFYGDGTFPTQEELFGHVYEVLERHPGLNATFAHFFFRSYFPEQVEAIFEKYPNVAVDLTPGREMYEAFGKRREYFRDFFTRYGDRLLYGTDASDDKPLEYNHQRSDTVYDFLTTDKVLHEWDYEFRGLALEDEVSEKILSGNFLRKVSPQPKQGNVDALKAYVKKYGYMIRDEERRREIEEETEKL